MDALRTASALARLLLTLRDAERDCDVWVERGAGRVRLGIVRGCAVSIAGVEQAPLGDTLLSLGQLDVASQRALLGSSDHGPIGARLVRIGATSPEALQQALRLQLFRGVDAILRGPCDGLRTVARDAVQSAAGGSGQEVAVDLTAAVWSALFGIAYELTTRVRAQLAGSQALSLSELGRRRVQGLLRAAHAGELVLRGHALSHTMVLSDALVVRALAAAPPAELLALRAILRVLGCVVASHAEHPYALLLRKRRELSRNASASALLDLPGPVSEAQVRRALRRLAHKLHPDRFERADDRLRAISSEVMRALLGAAHALGAPCSARSTL